MKCGYCVRARRGRQAGAAGAAPGKEDIVEEVNASSIFSPATGFIKRGGFDWTCNPYVGCSFGCRYCYAMFLPQNRRPREDWGRWIVAKRNAVELAHRRAPKLAGQAVYLSRVTDPYLPAERSLFLTPR